MKRICALIILPVLLVFSCGKYVSNPDENNGILSLNFNLETLDIKKTIEPGIDTEIQTYDIRGQGPNDGTFENLAVDKTSEYQMSLRPGHWIISVDAKNGDDIILGNGEVGVDVESGKVVQTTIIITPLKGSGTLSLGISWPADILVSPVVEGTLLSSTSTSTTLNFVLAQDGLSANYTGAWESGYYVLVLKLYDGAQQVWGKTEAVRILAGQTTNQTYPLVEEVNEGGLILTVNEAMQNPITVTLNGISGQITGGESIHVDANTSDAVDSYQWYLDGDHLQTENSSSITIGDTLDVGPHVLDIIVKKNQIFCSEGFSFTVLEPDTLPLDLYLLIGQSNMAGRGEISEIDTTTHPRVFMLTEDGQWVQAKEPVQFDKPIVGVGPGLAFGKRMANFSYKKYKRIGLVPAALGGSSIDEWQKGTTLYDQAMNYLSIAMNDGQLQGILWHQGEADRDSALAVTYEGKLIQFIDDLRGDLNDNNLPFLVGGMSDGFIRIYPYGGVVDQSLRNVADSLHNVSYVSAEGLTLQADSAHFDSESYREFGRRYADEMRLYDQGLK